MKLFIKHSLVFTLLLIFLFTIINLFQTFYNVEPVHYKKQYESIVNYPHEFNGIILGTSHATHSIRPTILDKSGIGFYNYSLNGANPEFYSKWYNNFIHDSKIKPKYCLYAVDFFMFDKDWLWRKFEQDVEFFPKQLFLNELLDDDDFNKFDLIVNRFPFLKYRTQIAKSLQLKKGSKDFNAENYDRGYISFSAPFDSSKFEPNLKFNIDMSQVKYFKALIEKMLSDDFIVLFVRTPEYGISVKDYKNMESLKIIDSISKELAIPILNYNTELNSNISQNMNYFTDWGHTNHSGAKIFSIALAKEIKALRQSKGYMQ